MSIQNHPHIVLVLFLWLFEYEDKSPLYVHLEYGLITLKHVQVQNILLAVIFPNWILCFCGVFLPFQ